MEDMDIEDIEMNVVVYFDKNKAIFYRNILLLDNIYKYFRLF